MLPRDNKTQRRWQWQEGHVGGEMLDMKLPRGEDEEKKGGTCRDWHGMTSVCVGKGSEKDDNMEHVVDRRKKKWNEKKEKSYWEEKERLDIWGATRKKIA